MTIRQLIDSLAVEEGTIFCEDYKIIFTKDIIEMYNETIKKTFKIKDSLKIKNKIIDIKEN